MTRGTLRESGGRRSEASGELLDPRGDVVVGRVERSVRALDDRVGDAMMSAGGPPAGLLSHVVYPGDVAGVWRTESEGRGYLDEVLRPLVTEVGLTPRETECLPAWSFARP